MKTGTLATRLTLAAILLTVLIYFGVNVAAYFNDPFTTTLAYGYTSESAVTVAGYVVREEEVLTGQGDLIYVSRREGEKVSQGGTVALGRSPSPCFWSTASRCGGPSPALTPSP